MTRQRPNSGTPVRTTDATFPFDVLRASGPVLVDFYADWCGMCRQLAPVLEQLAGDLAGQLTVVTHDVEVNPATPERLAIRSIPTLVRFADGEERARLINVVRRDAILAEISPHLRGAGQASR